MKSTLTDQELIDASKGAMLRGHQKLTPAHFTPEMLQSMRDIADAAVKKYVEAMPGCSIFPPPTRPVPATPKSEPVAPSYEEKLRDEFAGRAMQAAATNPTGADGLTFEERAAWAYMQADAMLAERIKSK